MANEKKIERDSARTAEVHGWLSKKFVTPGRRGAFDHIFIKAGRVVWIEFKDPDGEISPLQHEEYYDLIDHGADAHFCYSYEDCKQILGIHT